MTYLAGNEPNEKWAIEEQFTYYINLYNAGTVQLILNNYPLGSIKNIDDPWGKEFIKIGNNKVSLGSIEHDILRKMNEARIHFAINCASVSCPKLWNEAYKASEIDKQLKKATSSFINSGENDIQKEQAELSKIFDWYKKDFMGGDLVTFINQYSKVKIDEIAKISYKDYDWNLNEQ